MNVRNRDRNLSLSSCFLALVAQTIESKSSNSLNDATVSFARFPPKNIEHDPNRRCGEKVQRQDFFFLLSAFCVKGGGSFVSLRSFGGSFISKEVQRLLWVAFSWNPFFFFLREMLLDHKLLEWKVSKRVKCSDLIHRNKKKNNFTFTSPSKRRASLLRIQWRFQLGLQ